APRFGRGTAAARMESARVQSLARTLRERALDRGDLLNRIAFLYGVVPAVWPRALAPEQGLLAAADPDMVASRLPAYSRGLERARLLLEEREASDLDLAERGPAIPPIATRMAERAAFSGRRVSPWTGAREFFRGLEIAAPEGSAVLAAGVGTVLFAGSVRASPTGRLWELGNMVVVSHGASGVTLYGHLAKIE